MGKATTIQVTKAIAYNGMRVCRGKDWMFDKQDYDKSGRPGPGTIESTIHEVVGWVNVKWDTGGCYGYRVGADGMYDLYVYDDGAKEPEESKVVSTSDWTPTEGQTVRCIDGSNHWVKQAGLLKGMDYIVEEVYTSGQFIRVKNGKSIWIEKESFAPTQVISEFKVVADDATWKWFAEAVDKLITDPPTIKKESLKTNTDEYKSGSVTSCKVRRSVSAIQRPERSFGTPVPSRGSKAKSRCCNPGH